MQYRRRQTPTLHNGVPGQKDNIDDWKNVLSKWEKFSSKQRPKLRVLVRRGIPLEIRGEVWKVMSGASNLKTKSPGVYEVLVQQISQCENCLLKDVHRTPTQKILKLKENCGQSILYNVLKAYSVMDPELGYCQGMSFLCGILILYLDESDAFWVLVSLLRTYQLRGLFLQDLPLLKHYLYRFYYLVHAYMPDLATHFDKQGIQTLFYSAEWFSTLFTYNIQPELTFRIWDVLFLEGPEYLFRVGLAILKISEQDLLKLGFDDIMIYLKNKTLELDVTILGEADKFSKLGSLLEVVDKRFEPVQKKIAAGGSQDAALRPMRKSSGKKEIQNEKSKKENSSGTDDKFIMTEVGKIILFPEETNPILKNPKKGNVKL